MITGSEKVSTTEHNLRLQLGDLRPGTDDSLDPAGASDFAALGTAEAPDLSIGGAFEYD
jgi:hypothetical protein